MKATGVLFNHAMSAALRREVDPKTQTRRVCRLAVRAGMPQPELESLLRCCPYGVPGDLLWVRETFFAFGRWVTRFNAKKGRDEWCFVDMTLETGRAYLFDPPDGWKRHQRAAGGATPSWWKRPSIFMPRVAARIVLEVTAVRVERLQDISEADSIAEGVEPIVSANGGCRRWMHYAVPNEGYSSAWKFAFNSYASLWETINGPGSWDANPLVWVVEFRRVRP